MEQLTAVMAGGDIVEIKAVLLLEVLVLQPVCQSVILQAQTSPLDRRRLKEAPGIVGYVVQERTVCGILPSGSVQQQSM